MGTIVTGILLPLRTVLIVPPTEVFENIPFFAPIIIKSHLFSLDVDRGFTDQ